MSGRKRHIAVDVIGLLPIVLITTASVQDRGAARPLLWNLRKAFPKVRLAGADGIYASNEPPPRPAEANNPAAVRPHLMLYAADGNARSG